MASRDDLWRRYVEEYDVEVPESAIQNEVEYLKLAMRHNMVYDRLSGGGTHLFPDSELRDQADELRAAAVFEAKAPLVLKAIIAERGITVSREELEAEAAALAERQGSTIDMVRRFFGDDLTMLERDVLERKAIDWAVSAQAPA